MKEKFYVYIYLDPRTKSHFCYQSLSFLYKPLYIGKGQKRRYLDHLKYLEKHTNYDFKHVLKEILNEGFTKQDIENHIRIIPCNSEQEAFNLEIKLIKEIGCSKFGGPLTNWTDGGEGPSGWTSNEDFKKNLSKRMKSNNPMKSEESRKKVSENLKGKRLGNKNAMFGVDRSGDKHPRGMLGKHHSQKVREDQSKRMKDRFIGDKNPSKRLEVREKISQKVKLTNKRKRLLKTLNLILMEKHNGY